MKKIRVKGNLIKEKNNLEKSINSLDIMTNAIKNMLDSFKRKKTLEEILDIYEREIDDYILKVSKLEKLNYISGYLTVNPTSERVSIKIECYFQDKRESWLKKESISGLDRDDILDTMIECVETKYEIESPLTKMGGK